VAVLFDCIREIYKEVEPEGDKRLGDSFDNHVKNVMSCLTEKLQPNIESHKVNVHILTVNFFTQ